MVKRDLLNFDGIDRRDFEAILRLGCELKRKQNQGVPHALLAGKGLAMLFEKPSLRTRVTFETGMVQLGGHVVFLAPGEVQLGVRETPADCARSLSRWVDIIVVRTFAQATIEEMADSPTFLMAANPNRMPFVEAVKKTSLTLTSGGRMEMFISRHSLMYFTIFSWLPRSLVRIEAMK